MANYTSTHTGAQIDAAADTAISIEAIAAGKLIKKTATKTYAAVTKADITNLGIPAQDTTYQFNTAYNASTNKAATMADINTAIGNAIGGSY